MTSSSFDPGKVRSLQRVISDDGFFLVCAVDHLTEFEELLGAVGDVPFADIVAAKDTVIRAVAPSVSAVLLDPGYGIGHLVNSGALPGRVGLVGSIEEENYRFPDGPRGSILREDWSALQAKLAGVDLAKILWFYRPDLDPVVAARQRDLLRELHAQCAATSLPLVVEPIWYAVAGEDTTTAAWQESRVRGIVSSALEAQEIGLDVLKIEFPGDVSTQAGRVLAAEACRRIDDGVSAPWVILSAGVTFEEFTEQLTIACAAGASGYMAGRSVWRDVVAPSSPGETSPAEIVRGRIDRLNSIVRAHGRTFDPTHSLADTLDSLPEGWYSAFPGLAEAEQAG